MMGPDKTLATMSPQVYTDLSGLQNLGSKDKGSQIAAVAQQFESMMMQMMLKSMRDANAVFSEGNLLSSSEMEFYQEMFDHQLTLSLSQNGGGMGLAKALERQLGARAGLPSEAAAPIRPDDSLNRQHDINGVSGLVTAPIDRLLTRITRSTMPAEMGGADRLPQHNLGNAFDGSPDVFVATVAPLAEHAAAELGVDSRVLVSQAALETGWGNKMLRHADGAPSYNFFNIKAGSSWQGPVVSVSTLEYRNGIAVRETAAFRSYGSAEEGFADYARLIRGNPRYQEALQRAGDPEHYMQALAEAGYATDPMYAEKVMQILATDHVGGDTSRQ